MHLKRNHECDTALQVNVNIGESKQIKVVYKNAYFRARVAAVLLWNGYFAFLLRAVLVLGISAILVKK